MEKEIIVCHLKLLKQEIKFSYSHMFVFLVKKRVILIVFDNFYTQ